jgi:uncharacterized membrane protein YeaQ/YmgE (transglycosylase-associated protein family)
MNEYGSLPLGASTAFSIWGLLYVAIPVLVLLFAAWFVSRGKVHSLWPIVCGAIGASVGIVLMASMSDQHPNGLLDRNLALSVNLSACLGAVLGVAALAAWRAAVSAIVRMARSPDPPSSA